MVIILPRKQQGLAEVESRPTAEQLDGWIKSLKEGTSVAVQIPRFQMKTQLMLSDTLQSLGMKSAFTSTADFSGISTSDRPQISDVIHRAYVAVDERGIEAAAATAVVVELAIAAFPKSRAAFRADHPFLFLIRDQRTGAILFLGRLVRPEAA